MPTPTPRARWELQSRRAADAPPAVGEPVVRCTRPSRRAGAPRRCSVSSVWLLTPLRARAKRHVALTRTSRFSRPCRTERLASGQLGSRSSTDHVPRCAAAPPAAASRRPTRASRPRPLRRRQRDGLATASSRVVQNGHGGPQQRGTCAAAAQLDPSPHLDQPPLAGSRRLPPAPHGAGARTCSTHTHLRAVPVRVPQHQGTTQVSQRSRPRPGTALATAASSASHQRPRARSAAPRLWGGRCDDAAIEQQRVQLHCDPEEPQFLISASSPSARQRSDLPIDPSGGSARTAVSTRSATGFGGVRRSRREGSARPSCLTFTKVLCSTPRTAPKPFS